jgi:ATP-dependent exoDNAse (exonuclease V) alpha subunit
MALDKAKLLALVAAAREREKQRIAAKLANEAYKATIASEVSELASEVSESVGKDEVRPASLPSTIPETKLEIAEVILPSITIVADREVLPLADSLSLSTGLHGEVIHLNKEQLEAVELVRAGKSLVITGAAGTGKTTTVRAILAALTSSGRVPPLQEDTKWLRQGSPGAVSIAYTRRAVANIAKAMPPDMKDNCLTYHALVEYAPERYTVFDDTTGMEKETMRFVAQRNAYNPLPASLVTIIIEEGGMFSTDFYAELLIALPDPDAVQFIFLGDLFQLPPVYGASILGFKLNELPVVELTHVYRQALESPIIRLAHHVKDGKFIPDSKFHEWNYPGELTIHPWKKQLPDYAAIKAVAAFLNSSIDEGVLDPDNDIILTPYNKNFGTLELNKLIANHLGKKRGAIVHEVIAGFEKVYLAVGDKVMYNKNDGIITAIARNTDYSGKRPKQASATLDRWGTEQNFLKGTEAKTEEEQREEEEFEMLNIEAILAMHVDDAVKDRKQVASHTITIRMLGSGQDVDIDTAGEINKLLLGYALTVHKSQGSEWRKVYLILHKSQNTMISRELLYTAITRAREELYIICDPDHFIKGVVNQRIKGTTLLEKAKFFAGKQEDRERELAMLAAAEQHKIKEVKHYE